MRKEENSANPNKMSTKINEPEAMDGTDILIMQTLSDELSDITVSEELIARTLRAAEEKKKAGEERKKKARVYRIWGGALTAAAALLVIVLGVGTMRFGMKDASNEYSGSAANESMMDDADSAVQEEAVSMESSNTTMNEPAVIPGGETKGEWKDIFSDENSYETNGFYGEETCDSEMQGWSGAESDMAEASEGGFDAAEPFLEKETAQEAADGMTAENGRWLYDELLAAFDTAEEITMEPEEAVEGDVCNIS